MVVDEQGDIWFHQSWLETAMRCNERGRLSLVHPEFSEGQNDAALIGTATHEAIAGVLEGTVDPDEIGDAAVSAALRICTEEEVRWTKWTLPTQLAQHARRCAEAWVREILPCVPMGGLVEVDFNVPLFESGERIVGIEGTIDYASPDGTLWDWKTSSKKYDQRGKQRVAIQPTVYATAAMHGALGPETKYRYPIRFHFGVMVRGEAKATTQVVDVMRSHAHETWLVDHLRTYIDVADALGVKRHWPRNEDHYLCNEVWCPWWSICKGARLSDSDNTWS